jgi:imidazolonepropionase-like amidohydrolase
MLIALVGGKVIDGNGGEPLEGGTVVIDGTKIVEISEKRKFSSDVVVLDATGKTVMPGLIDTHVHYSPWFQWLISSQAKALTYWMSKTVLHMRLFLQTGVTTARDMGGLEVGFAEAQADGLIPGPRTKAALVIIQATNGLTDNMPGVGGTITPQGLTAFLPGLPSPWADGEDGVRAKVREVLRYGADIIKCANTATPWTSPKLRPDRPLFTRAELDAIVDEAHRAGVQVCCHVTGYESTDSTLDAIRAGVDLIDHGSLLDDECVSEMARRGTYYCPMFAIMDFHRKRNPDLSVRPIAEVAYELTRASFRKAVDAGVRICMGTDQAIETGWQGLELECMVENGLTPMEALVVSTRQAAQALGMEALVGTLEAGKEADLLVLDGDPVRDVRVLQNVENLLLVMQAGKPVYGALSQQLPYEPVENLSLLSAQPTKRSW